MSQGPQMNPQSWQLVPGGLVLACLLPPPLQHPPQGAGQAGCMWGVKERPSGGISGFWLGSLRRREKGAGGETSLRKMKLVDSSERKRNETLCSCLLNWDFLFFSYNILRSGRSLGRKALLFKISLWGTWTIPLETPFFGSWRLFGRWVSFMVLWKANMPPETMISQGPLSKGQWTWSFSSLATYPSPSIYLLPSPFRQTPGHSAAPWNHSYFQSCWAFSHPKDIIFAVPYVWYTLPHLSLSKLYLNITYVVFLPTTFNVDLVMRK